MKFSQVYIDNVLAENFEDAKRLFFEPLMAIHRAHLAMLARVGVVGLEQARQIAAALDQITQEKIAPAVFDGSFEDLFYYVESLLAERCGKRVAGQLHTARSRNDIDVTLYRLRWRVELVEVAAAALDLRETLLTVCRRELETVFPVHTHTQPAQPSTVAHYFLGLVEHLERDHRRLRAALETMNRCPMGSCAISGTGFPIDRELVSRLLAFDGPTGNTYGGVAGVDYLLEAVAALMVLLTTLGKLIHDLLVWSMSEFRYLRLEDGFVQPSSIMPQKRNPVALEHARALASRGLGQAGAVFQMLHNTPYGDIVDVEDDLQPLVCQVFRDTLRPLRLVSAALATARFDRPRLEALASQNGVTMTELADTLVRREGFCFRTAHQAVAAMTSALAQDPDLSPARALADATRAVGKEIGYSEEDLEKILGPRHFVEVRDHLGGPAPATVSEALTESLRLFEADRSWTNEQARRFGEFPARLRRELRQL